MQVELFFKVGYISAHSQSHDSTGCDEMGDYFAIEADTMIEIVRLTWIKIVFEYLYLIGILIK